MLDARLEQRFTHFCGQIVELAVFFWPFRGAGAWSGNLAVGLALEGQGLPPLPRSAGHIGQNGGVGNEELAGCGAEELFQC